MNLLGKIGIDLKLIIAQIINFSILVFILYKLVYKPIIKRIEEEQKEEEALKLKERLIEQQEKRIEQDKKRIIENAKMEASSILHSVEELKKELEEKFEKELNLQKEILLKKYSEFLEQKQKDIIFQNQLKIKSEIFKKLKIWLKESLKSPQRKALHNFYFKELLKDLRFIPEDIASTEIPQITITSPFPLEKQKKQIIEKYLEKKFNGKNKKIKIKYKIEKSLIAGFKFEIGGVLFEKNIISDLYNLIYEK